MLFRSYEERHFRERSGEWVMIEPGRPPERTREHEQLFRDGVEAVFWNDAAECTSRCRWLLENPAERDAIAAAGRRRVQQLGIGNEEMVAQVLERVAATHVRKSERSVIASCR